MANPLIIPAFMLINRIRGMDFKGHRIVAAVLAAVSYILAGGFDTNWHTLYLYLTVSLGFWLWSVPAWLPRDNWSGAQVIYDLDEKESWYGWTIMRQLYAYPLFIGLAVFNNDWRNLSFIAPILFG